MLGILNIFNLDLNKTIVNTVSNILINITNIFDTIS